MRIREAAAGDAPAIRDIYNDAVANTTAIWNERLVDAADRAAWIEAHARAGRPVLVATTPDPTKSTSSTSFTAPTIPALPAAPLVMAGFLSETPGVVLGYAAYGDWRAFDGYRLSVEHSVYVHAKARGHGVGTALLRALIERARVAGMHVMVAAISGDNAVSIRLHERHGFARVGRMPQVGMKFGRWLDLEIMQLTLDARERPEEPGRVQASAGSGADRARNSVSASTKDSR